MIVWVLHWGNLGDGEIVGVFSTQEKAEAARLRHPQPNELSIADYEVDEGSP